MLSLDDVVNIVPIHNKSEWKKFGNENPHLRWKLGQPLKDTYYGPMYAFIWKDDTVTFDALNNDYNYLRFIKIQRNKRISKRCK